MNENIEHGKSKHEIRVVFNDNTDIYVSKI